MRRFSLMILSLAVFFALVSCRQDNAKRQSTDDPASANSKVLEAKEMLQAVAGEPSGEPPVQSAAPEPSETNSSVLKTAAVLQKPAGAATLTEQSGVITSAPTHISASAKTGGIDPALEGMADRDLTSAAQSELKRLGCYNAKVDGNWGRKSQAALKAFGERAGGTWADTSRRELVAALRNYPAAFCTTECAAKAGGGQCAVAAAPKGNESVGAAKDTSYLPPWMRDAKLTNVEPPLTASPGEQKTLPDVVPLTSKPKKSKNVRRRGGYDDRAAQRYERRRVSRGEWRLNNWPGTQ
jgi:hypothetical protein